MNVLELLLKYLSYPVTIVISVVILALLFRRPLTGVIQRGGLRLGKEGLRIDPVASVAAPVETDEKGNVKPPPQLTGPDTPSDDIPSGSENIPADRSEISWFLQLRHAYYEEGDCLTKVTEYYNKLRSLTLSLVDIRQVEAEYLLSRFRCGDPSALPKLKAQSAPTSEAFFVNAALGDYYESIGEETAALQCFQYKFDHAPDKARKFRAALSLGDFLAKIGKAKDAISFLEGQMSYFDSSIEHAEVWETIGRIHGRCGSHWRKHLCFEKSLMLNPDNVQLRFSLAYSYSEHSYGRVLAAHHYQILQAQSPRDSVVANNLSIIYHEVGAVSAKISLLRYALHRKDSAYVSANLAIAYAKAGFLDDARECLRNIPEHEQHEPIVQSAHNAVSSQREADDQIIEKINKATQMQQRLVTTTALQSLHGTDDALAEKFVGDWYFEGATVLRLLLKGKQFIASMITENEYYEQASYNVTTKYEPGLLEISGHFDEASLKERLPRVGSVAHQSTTSPLGGLGSLGGALGGNTLLTSIFNRPPADVKLILFPGASNTLDGLKTISISPTGKEEDNSRMMLRAFKVHLTKWDGSPPLLTQQ